jgi:hypothetical protein
VHRPDGRRAFAFCPVGLQGALLSRLLQAAGLQGALLSRLLQASLEALLELSTVEVLADENQAVHARRIAPRRESLASEEHVHTLQPKR